MQHDEELATTEKPVKRSACALFWYYVRKYFVPEECDDRILFSILFNDRTHLKFTDNLVMLLDDIFK